MWQAVMELLVEVLCVVAKIKSQKQDWVDVAE